MTALITTAAPSTITRRIRAAVAAAVKGSALEVSEDTSVSARRYPQLFITNPAQPGRGRIGVTLGKGFVYWQRADHQTDYFGHLDGIGCDCGEPHPAVPAVMIALLLTAKGRAMTSQPTVKGDHG